MALALLEESQLPIRIPASATNPALLIKRAASDLVTVGQLSFRLLSQTLDRMPELVRDTLVSVDIMTRAPAASAISRVASVEFESTTTISSAHATDSHASLIFGSSLKVMMVALTLIKQLSHRFSRINTDQC
jgi:hypothetical protein